VNVCNVSVFMAIPCIFHCASHCSSPHVVVPFYFHITISLGTGQAAVNISGSLK